MGEIVTKVAKKIKQDKKTSIIVDFKQISCSFFAQITVKSDDPKIVRLSKSSCLAWQ